MRGAPTSYDELSRTYKHSVLFHVGKEESRFGWTKPHENRADDPPSLPAIDIDTGEPVPPQSH